MTLIEEIEAARKRLGLTMAELASRSGRSEAAYSRAASGQTRPSARTIKAFQVAIELIAAERAEARERIKKIAQLQEERNAA